MNDREPTGIDLGPDTWHRGVAAILRDTLPRNPTSPPPAAYDSEVFDEAYYMHGRESGKSLYENYTWKADLTLPMCRRLIEYLGIQPRETVNDFGCARGYVVKAFRWLGYEAYGQDISEWAIEHADEEVKRYLQVCAMPLTADWILAKDVLEHIPDGMLEGTLAGLARAARRGLFIVVPLGDGERYIIPEYEKDITHRQRLPLTAWYDLLARSLPEDEEWTIETTYRVHGVKDNWAQYARGNGFLTARRMNCEN